MITIGLTGSIGMGKTETGKIFAALGVPVFDSDAAVHELMGPGGKAVERVEQEFSGVTEDGAIDRKLLGERVFENDAALIRLENILHPMVIEKRRAFLENQTSDVTVFDIPLLFEKGYEDQFDHIIVVSAPYDVQKERVLARPNMTAERFQEILEKQMPDAEKREKADFIIQTDKGIEYARAQAEEILEKIRKQHDA